MNAALPPAAPAPCLSGVQDEQALAAAASRDRAAFAQLYRSYLTRVYAYALSRVGNEQDANDITSQTFLAALEGIGSYRGQSKFSTWLFGIARNKCADFYRGRGRTGRECAIEAAAELSAPDAEPHELIERRLKLEELARKTRFLSADQAEALCLRIFAGLSAAEAGQVMGKSEPAVKMLVHRAIHELQPRLGHWMEAEQ